MALEPALLCLGGEFAPPWTHRKASRGANPPEASGASLSSRRWRPFRSWLARRGISPQRHVYSRSIWNVTKPEVWESIDFGTQEVEEHGRARGCDAWPIHVVLRELERGSGFGFAHFNDGECRCIIDGAHKNRDGIDICPEEVRHLLRRSLQSLAAAPDPIGCARDSSSACRARGAVGFSLKRCSGGSPRFGITLGCPRPSFTTPSDGVVRGSWRESEPGEVKSSSCAARSTTWRRSKICSVPRSRVC